MPGNRVKDKPYGAYSVYAVLKTGICVTCPRCGRMGLVTSKDGQNRFQCTNCGYVETKEQSGFQYRVQNLCESCGRYYNVPIWDQRQQTFPMLPVQCPYCGFVMPGRVEKIQQSAWYTWVGDVKRGQDPAFGFDLWFLTDFDGKLVWALNREHLAYLIDYLSADLREKPPDYPGLRTAADGLPTFMKTAKNRNRIVKRLKKLQEK
ncbi:MAG: hypothetical protein HDT37_06455 [Clostridiales bacterium]|nr:hypothetical protein [Clostridiales bacterium]